MTDTTPIPLFLTVPQVNLILAALGKRPLEEVLDVFVAVKGQADEGVKMAELKARTTAPAEGA